VTRFQPGDTVVVSFQGVEMTGQVISQSPASGYVMARVTVPDPELDLGSISARIDPQPIVCVKPSDVRPV